VKDSEVILFFDGVCNLCNGFVDFSLKYSADDKVKFASLQGETASKLLPSEIVKDLDTVCLYIDGHTYTRSDAVAHLATHLRFPWSLLNWIRIFPRPLRDWGYKFVAKNRYRLFGQKETCRLPTPEERGRLLA
jgi:predicted DCC family thiol-disulfide oxidoreductase YuxK